MSVTPESPRRVGPYDLLDPLGEGGMARVYLARRDGAHDLCVLKLLHVQLATQGEVARRFQREAHIASQLNHPGIAQVLDAGWQEDRFYLAMELIEGETLEALIAACRAQGGVMPLAVSVQIALEALDALHYAHALVDPDGRPMGLVHRDLSPRNIMVGYDGSTRLIDFGIAKGSVDEFKTAVGVLMGTPYYMSPEQAQALPVDHRSDLYTVAAVLHEMLTGQRLVQARGRAKILLSVVQEEAPAARAANPHVPEAVDRVLQRALAKAPKERFASARAFRDALANAAGHLATSGIEPVRGLLASLFEDRRQQAQTRRAAWADLGGPAADPTRVATPDRSPEPVTPSELSAPLGADSRTRTAAGPLDAPTALAPTRAVPDPRGPTVPGVTRSVPGLAVAPHPPRARALRGLALGVLGVTAIAAGGLAWDTLGDSRGPYDAQAILPAGEPPSPPAAIEAPAPVAQPRAESPSAEAEARPRPEPPASPRTPSPSARRGRDTGAPPAAKSVSGSDPEPRTSPTSARRGRDTGAPPAAKSVSGPDSGISAPAAKPPAAKKPASTEAERLRRRLAQLRGSRDKTAVFGLARDIRRAGARIAEPRRSIVQSEADRVFLTGDVGAMLEALDNALDELDRVR